MRTDPASQLFHLPVSGYRYLLVISPAMEVAQAVDVLKAQVERAIGTYRYRHSKAHITLFHADLPVECERDLCEGIERGAVGQRKFDLHYDGITHFENKQTIYIDPVEKLPIDSLRKSVVAHTRSFKRLKKLGINPSDHPHLTIAAGLELPQFATAWALLAPHTFKREDRVMELILLRKGHRANDKYQQVRSFPLG